MPKEKSKSFTKPEDILSQGSLQQVKQMFEAAVKKSEIIQLEAQQSPLHYAVFNPDSTVLLYLLEEQRLNPNVLDKFKRAPLDCAVQKGCFDNIKLLIEYGADFTRKNNKGLTIIYALKGYKHFSLIDAVQELMKIAEQKKQFVQNSQTNISTDAYQATSRQRSLSNASSDDSSTVEEISDNASSPSSSGSETRLLQKISVFFGYPSASSPEKESLLPPNKKFKHD